MKTLIMLAALIAAPAPYIDNWPPILENGFELAVEKCTERPWEFVHFRYLGEDGRMRYYITPCERVLAIAKLREKIET